MGPGTALLSSLRRSLDFGGRSGRAEFWWAFPALWLIGLALGMLAPLVSARSVTFALLMILGWAVVLPMMALGTRRLADAGAPRWLFVAALVLGQVAMLAWLLPIPRYQGTLDFLAERSDVVLPMSGYQIDHFIRNLRTTILPRGAQGLLILSLLLALLPTRRPRPTPVEVTP